MVKKYYLLYFIFSLHVHVLTRHLGRFHNLASVNSDDFYMNLQGPLWDVESLDWYSWVICQTCLQFSLFLFWNLHTGFHTGWIFLHSPQQCLKISFPNILSSLSCCLLFNDNLPHGLTQNLKAFLTFMTLSVKDIEHFSLSLLSIIICKRVCSLTHVLTGCLVLDHLVFGSLYVSSTNPLSDGQVANVFLSACGHLFP